MLDKLNDTQAPNPIDPLPQILEHSDSFSFQEVRPIEHVTHKISQIPVLLGPFFPNSQNVGLPEISLAQKRKARSTSPSFSDWDELGRVVKQVSKNQSDQFYKCQEDQSNKAHTSNYKTLDNCSISTNSSTDSHSLSQTPPNTPNSLSSFTSAQSDFPLEEWDFDIDPMDLNTSLDQAESSAVHKQGSNSPQRIIKRRRKRVWKPVGLLSQVHNT